MVLQKKNQRGEEMGEGAWAARGFFTLRNQQLTKRTRTPHFQSHRSFDDHLTHFTPSTCTHETRPGIICLTFNAASCRKRDRHISDACLVLPVFPSSPPLQQALVSYRFITSQYHIHKLIHLHPSIHPPHTAHVHIQAQT